MFGELPAAHLPSPQRSSSRRDTRGVRVPDSPTAPRPGQTDTPGGKDSGAKVRSAFGAVAAAGAAPAGPQARQTIAVSLLALPAGRIRRRSLMNQVKHPATGWRNPLICGRRRTSPAPCLAAAHLPVSPLAGSEGTKEQRARTAAPAPATEGGSGCRQSPFACRHGCEECSRSPYCLGSFVLLRPPVPNRTGRNSGSRTDTALLKGALECGKPPAPALPYVPVWHTGPHCSCPRGQVRSRDCRAVRTDGRR